MTEMQEMADAIAREVIRQLNCRTEGLAALRPAGKPEKPCIMIMGARDAKLAAGIRTQLDEDVDFQFFMEPGTGRVPSRTILPSLCCATMADLALGRASGALMTEVLRLLLSGVEIEVLEFGYKAYAETAPGPLYSLYESYEKTLAGYGLKAFRRKQPGTVRFRERVVTEKDVTAVQEKGASVLMVPATAVVTPLAQEAAKNMNINILKHL